MRQYCVYKVTKSYPSMRQYTSLSTAHQKKLEKLLKEIKEWVYDSNSGETNTLNIESYSLRKALQK